MVAIIPPEYVAKPTENFPLRYGLFQAAIGPLDLPPHARIGGLRYQTGVCGEGFGYEVECIDALDTKSGLGLENGTTDVLGAPFIVYATSQCGAAGTTYDEQRGFAIERLRSVEQSVVEEVFSTATFGQGSGLTTADGIETVTGGGTTAVQVLSELERARYCGGTVNTAQYGPRAIIHTPIAVLNELKSQHAVEWDGTRWRTAMGTVVSGGCYANEDPDGAPAADGTFWMYITGQTTIWRTSDANLFIPPVEGALNRTTNQYNFLVEREYVVTYECGGFAKEVTLWS